MPRWMITITLAAAVLGVVVQGQAQPVRDQVEAGRTNIELKRQAVISANLILTAEESKGFWPLYHEYRAAVARKYDRMVGLIADYVANADQMSDKQAEEMMNEFWTTQLDTIVLKQDYYPRFRKILPVKKAVRFFQLDNRLDASVQADVSRQLPLVE
jgi:hypothetical protein